MAEQTAWLYEIGESPRLSRHLPADGVPVLLLARKLALARKALLGSGVTNVDLLAMGADPWYGRAAVDTGVRAFVASVLRDLAHHLEKDGIEFLFAQPLLLDEMLQQHAQKLGGAVRDKVGAGAVGLQRVVDASADV